MCTDKLPIHRVRLSVPDPACTIHALYAAVVVVGCCWLLLVVVGCCWLLLVVVGCSWLLLSVVVGCCWLLLSVVVVIVYCVLIVILFIIQEDFAMIQYHFFAYMTQVCVTLV